MTTVEEIEHAAAQLAPAEFQRLASWVSERHHNLWKNQLNADSEAGKLDFLFSEAATERKAGELRDWPTGKE